jgi:hypothetical protein
MMHLPMVKPVGRDVNFGVRSNRSLKAGTCVVVMMEAVEAAIYKNVSVLGL